MSNQLLSDAAAFAKLQSIDPRSAGAIRRMITAGDISPSALASHMLSLSAHDPNASDPDVKAYLSLIEPACRHAYRTQAPRTPEHLN